MGLYANFINVLTHCTCPFVYQTLKRKQYSVHMLIVHSNKIHFSFEPGLFGVIVATCLNMMNGFREIK